MKRKIRLMTTIVAMCMVVLIMSMGIYAATQVTVGGTGTITFTKIDDVSANVTYAYGSTPEDTKVYTLADSESTLGDAVAIAEAQNITFDSQEDSYTITFKVENTFDGNYSINAALSQSLTSNEFITMSTSYKIDDGAETNVTEASKTISIEKDKTMTLTVVFDIVDSKYQELKETGVDLNYTIQLVLTKAN